MRRAKARRYPRAQCPENTCLRDGHPSRKNCPEVPEIRCSSREVFGTDHEARADDLNLRERELPRSPDVRLLLSSPFCVNDVVGRRQRRVPPAVRDRGTMKHDGCRGAESQERSEPDQNHAQVINLSE